MEHAEHQEGIYRIKASAPSVDGGGYVATLVIERELRGRTAEAYREEGIECARVFDQAATALSHAIDRAWQIIHRQPSRLMC